MEDHSNRMPSPTDQTENPQKVALDSLSAITRKMEIMRAQVASYYAIVNADDFPIVEHEVGESLMAIRKAVARMRKAMGVLAQEALPGMKRQATEMPPAA